MLTDPKLPQSVEPVYQMMVSPADICTLLGLPRRSRTRTCMHVVREKRSVCVWRAVVMALCVRLARRGGPSASRAPADAHPSARLGPQNLVLAISM